MTRAYITSSSKRGIRWLCVVGSFQDRVGREVSFDVFGEEDDIGFGPWSMNWNHAGVVPRTGELGMAHCFGAKDGDRAKASDFQIPIPEKLLEVQLGQPELISRDIEVVEEYGLLRSFRRGAETRAMNAGVSDADIHLNCRWRAVEKLKGERPRQLSA
jgi:hypothetical protein